MPVEFAAVRSALQAVVAAGRVPGIAVAVSRNGSVVWEEGFGAADRERGLPATPDTPFYVASVSKSLTATALMTFVERGLIGLDEPVNWYLGGAGVHSPMWNAASATIRRVASHTAGLTTFTHWCAVGDAHCSTSIDREIRRYGILFWPPGELFDYSNLGYGILGSAIEHAAGEPLAKVMDRDVFEPLRMTHCFIDGDRRPSGEAARYDQHTHRRSPERVSGHSAASGAHCSAHDLALFGMFQLKDHLAAQRQILIDADVDQMHTPQASTRGEYGIGWWIRSADGVVSAQGGTSDAYALLALVASHDAAVTILANSFDPAIAAAADDLIRAVLHNAPSHQESVATPPPVDDGLRGSWTGTIQTYRGSVPLQITIDVSGQVRGALRRRPPVSFVGVRLRANHVYGRFPALTQSIPDASRAAKALEVDLFLRGDRLVGAATTGPPAGEDGDQLPHWTVLTRAAPPH